MEICIMGRTVSRQSPEKLLSILQSLNLHFPLYCGGNGQCGKCLVRVTKGWLAITADDRRCLSAEQLAAGYRLGCRAVVEDDCTIELTGMAREDEFYVPSLRGGMDVSAERDAVSAERNAVSVESDVVSAEGESVGKQAAISEGSPEKHLGIAVDIGTTTIAMVMVDLDRGLICGEYTGINRQRSLGVDVLARIQAAVSGHGARLRQLIREDLAAGLSHLMENYPGKNPAEEIFGQVEMMVLAGNTAMIHLLRGYDCSGLGQYPFRPHRLKTEILNIQELLGEQAQCFSKEKSSEEPAQRIFMGGFPVMIFPGISAFIGGDATAGLLACGMDKAQKPRLFIDIGTNAEMAVGCEGNILATSAAAGPAFEGGNLSSGTGSIAGAVRDIKIQYGLVRYETIGRRAPVGICGTGVVSGMAELLKNRWIDADGCYRPRYAASGMVIVPGKISLTQGDIREFQKAKAAIRAGLELLLKKGGYTYGDMEQLIIAGSFGCQMDVTQAADIGLIPERLADKTVQMGNTVIGGLVQFMTEIYRGGRRSGEMQAAGFLDGMAGRVQEMVLAEEGEFYREYMAHMRLERG